MASQIESQFLPKPARPTDLALALSPSLSLASSPLATLVLFPGELVSGSTQLAFSHIS